MKWKMIKKKSGDVLYIHTRMLIVKKNVKPVDYQAFMRVGFKYRFVGSSKTLKIAKNLFKMYQKVSK